MTKKDYELIIRGLLEGGLWYNDGSADPIYKGIVNQLARVLLEDNPKFDFAKFTKACGVPKLEQ